MHVADYAVNVLIFEGAPAVTCETSPVVAKLRE
jgi:hypothetical protein